jgi:hypothetical protein
MLASLYLPETETEENKLGQYFALRGGRRSDDPDERAVRRRPRFVSHKPFHSGFHGKLMATETDRLSTHGRLKELAARWAAGPEAIHEIRVEKHSIAPSAEVWESIPDSKS